MNLFEFLSQPMTVKKTEYHPPPQMNFYDNRSYDNHQHVHMIQEKPSFNRENFNMLMASQGDKILSLPEKERMLLIEEHFDWSEEQ